MRCKLSSIVILFCSLPVVASEQEQVAQISDSIHQCRNIPSILERVHCYDNIKISSKPHTLIQVPQNLAGIVWQRAQNQEKYRDNKNIHFIHSETDNPQSFILTTPALGYVSQRPILMLSCIDNITRLQVASPVSFGNQGILGVKLVTENTEQSSQWFLRENGFVLEASRGLDGIKEIQKLFHSGQLKIQIESDVFKELVFNIENLSEEIKPLRAMCHW